MEKIRFETENGEEEFYILGETTLQGRHYLLVSSTPPEVEDGEFSVLVDMASPEDDFYDLRDIEDREELVAVIKVFNEMFDDIDLEV